MKNLQRIVSMLRLIILIFGTACCFILVPVEGLAQVNQKKVCKGELVQFELSSYSGEIKIQWQHSQDANTWSSIPGATNPNYIFTVYTDDYYRAELTEEPCIPYYSDTIEIVVDTLFPVAVSATDIGSYYFDANWDAVNGAKGYYLDIASDAGFTAFVQEAMDAGNFTTYSISYALCNTTYYYRVRAYFDENGDSLSCNSNVVAVTTNACPEPVECTVRSTCNGTITDSRDNKTYKTVQIGTQCWMAENLNIGTMIMGALQQTQGTDNQIEKYCYGDDTTNCTKYGGLYLWDEMMAYGASKVDAPGPQGICPTGWHLPTDIEWVCLEKTLGGDTIAGGELKDTTGWDFPNTGATNSSGFAALPGGFREGAWSFYSVSQFGCFWTATESNASIAWRRFMSSYSVQSIRYTTNKTLYGFSVRCLKD